MNLMGRGWPSSNHDDVSTCGRPRNTIPGVRTILYTKTKCQNMNWHPSLHTLSSKTDFMNTSIYYIDAYSKLTKAICVLVSAERGKGKGWKTFVINKLERLFVNRQNAPIVQHHHRPDCQIASLFPISYFATLFEKRNLFKKVHLNLG